MKLKLENVVEGTYTIHDEIVDVDGVVPLSLKDDKGKAVWYH